jgi:Cu/Ag efflux protein CusF
MNKRFSLQLLAAACFVPLALSSMAQTAAQPEWINAEVTRLQLDRKRVTLKHERIPSIKMDAMTMPFKLKDIQLFDGYKVGDKLQIVVKNDDGDLFITQVRKQPEAK